MTKVDLCFLCSIIYAYWKRNNNTKFTFSFRLIIYWCLLTCSPFSHNSGLLPQNRVPGQRFFCAKQLCANDLLKAPIQLPPRTRIKPVLFALQTYLAIQAKPVKSVLAVAYMYTLCWSMILKSVIVLY